MESPAPKIYVGSLRSGDRVRGPVVHPQLQVRRDTVPLLPPSLPPSAKDTISSQDRDDVSLTRSSVLSASVPMCSLYLVFRFSCFLSRDSLCCCHFGRRACSRVCVWIFAGEDTCLPPPIAFPPASPSLLIYVTCSPLFSVLLPSFTTPSLNCRNPRACVRVFPCMFCVCLVLYRFLTRARGDVWR